MSNTTRRSFVKHTGIAALGAAALGAAATVGLADEPAEQPLKVKLVYFSPTGNTVSAGMILTNALSSDVELIDQTSYASRQEEIEFAEDDLVVILSSTIAGRLPMAPGLFENLKGNDTPCIAAACFGNRDCEMTVALIAEMAAASGFNVLGGIAMVTDHTLGRFLGHGRPDVDDHAVICEFAETVKEKLASGDLEPVAIEGDPSCYEKYNPEGTIFQAKIPKEYYPENCIHCGVCAQECPANAIDPETLEIDADVCIHCQRCTYVCRNRGRYFFLPKEFEQGDNYWSHKDLKVYL